MIKITLVEDEVNAAIEAYLSSKFPKITGPKPRVSAVVAHRSKDQLGVSLDVSLVPGEE